MNTSKRKKVEKRIKVLLEIIEDGSKKTADIHYKTCVTPKIIHEVYNKYLDKIYQKATGAYIAKGKFEQFKEELNSGMSFYEALEMFNIGRNKVKVAGHKINKAGIDFIKSHFDAIYGDTLIINSPGWIKRENKKFDFFPIPFKLSERQLKWFKENIEV